MKQYIRHSVVAAMGQQPLTVEELSEGKKKLELAMSAMLRGDYFFLETIANLRIRATLECNVAAVMVNPMPTLLYNPRSVGSMNIKQIIYVLKHEIFHIMLEHFMRSEEFYTPYRLNCAQDLEVNGTLGEPPIAGALFPGKGEYKKLQLGEVFELYYNKLPADPVGQTGKDGNEPGTGSGNPFEVSHLQDYTPDDVGTVHMHDIIKDAVEKSRSMGQDISGDLQRLIDNYLKKNNLNWKRLLRNLIGAGVKFNHKPSWKRPSRRFGCKQKGKQSLKTMDIVIGMDTSGSISDEEIRQFLGEIEGIKRTYPCSIWIVQCDAKVTDTKKFARYEKLTYKYHGGGGTDFRPVFKWMEDNKLAGAQLVYFTDLYGEFPTKESTKVHKVTWVVPPSSRGTYDCKPPFGYVIRIPDDEAQRMRKKR
jgi:predicted metal-dependent peptidase